MATLIEVIQKMVTSADKVGHQTVWLDHPQEHKVFVFISWHPETAQKAEDALRAAGCLCSTVIEELEVHRE